MCIALAMTETSVRRALSGAVSPGPLPGYLLTSLRDQCQGPAGYIWDVVPRFETLKWFYISFFEEYLPNISYLGKVISVVFH